MPKKKVGEAAPYKVDMISSRPGSPVDAVTKTISASNDQEALRKATQGDPQAARYNQIRVTKPTPGQPVERPQAVMPPQQAQPAIQQPMQVQNPSAPPAMPNTALESKRRITVNMLIEALPYPYAIMLPRGYREALEPARRAMLINLNESNGMVYAKVQNKADMLGFIKTLKKQNSFAANVILKGIKDNA